MAEQSAWHASVQREDAHKQQQQDGGTAAAAAHSTAAGQAAQPASASASPPPSGLGDLAASMPSLFPSLLSPSPFHHSPSHSIVTLSAAAPSLVPPSPLLSESPSAPQQHQHLGNEHILNNPRLIVNVWQSNLQEELAKILQIVDEYPYIAMVRTRAGRITGKRASAAAGSAQSRALRAAAQAWLPLTLVAICCVLRSSMRLVPQDTEFPGVVARPGGTFKTSPDYAYQTLSVACGRGRWRAESSLQS